MTDRFSKARRVGIVAAMGGTLIGTTACGVVLYPERKGQVDGRIDPAVAVLDAVGLLFFIVPGVIAFAVDFATGAIYLPGSTGFTTLDMDDANVYRMDADSLDAKTIQRVIQEQIGEQVSLADPALRTRSVDSEAWLPLGAVLDRRQYAALTGARMQATR